MPSTTFCPAVTCGWAHRFPSSHVLFCPVSGPLFQACTMHHICTATQKVSKRWGTFQTRKCPTSLGNECVVSSHGGTLYIILLFPAWIKSIAGTYFRTVATLYTPRLVLGSSFNTWRANFSTTLSRNALKHTPSISHAKNCQVFGSIVHILATEKVPTHGSTSRWPPLLSFVNSSLVQIVISCSSHTARFCSPPSDHASTMCSCHITLSTFFIAIVHPRCVNRIYSWAW